MNEKHFQEWEGVRKKGQWRYVLVIGVLCWGGFMMVAMAFVNAPFSEGIHSARAITHCVVWPLSGLLFGFVMWWKNEKSYKNYMSESDNET